MAEAKRTLVTKEGLEELKRKLDHKRSVERPAVAQRLKEAIAMGDLSENSEYDEAKTAQAFLEGEILELEQKIRTAEIIPTVKGKKNRVQLGSKVIVTDLEDGSEMEITIVGSTESDPFSGRISNESPLGMQLMNAKVGQIVEVDAPHGVIKYKIGKING